MSVRVNHNVYVNRIECGIAQKYSFGRGSNCETTFMVNVDDFAAVVAYISAVKVQKNLQYDWDTVIQKIDAPCCGPVM